MFDQRCSQGADMPSEPSADALQAADSVQAAAEVVCYFLWSCLCVCFSQLGVKKTKKRLGTGFGYWPQPVKPAEYWRNAKPLLLSERVSERQQQVQRPLQTKSRPSRLLQPLRFLFFIFSWLPQPWCFLFFFFSGWPQPHVSPSWGLGLSLGLCCW